MSTQTPVSAPKKSGNQPRELPKQPGEQFWQRYSAHHEFPLSTITSVAAHFMVAGLIVIVAFYLAPWRDDKEKPLAMDTISAGGGGDPEGAPDSTGTGPAAESQIIPPTDTTKQQSEKAIPVLADEKIQPDQLPVPTAINFDDYIKNNTAAKDAIAKMPALDRELVKGLAGGSGKPKEKGGGGSGTGGGTGSGVGTGKGDGVGAGDQQMLNKRIERKQRWIMNFATFDGRDYAKQLEDLGAIVAAPNPGEGGKYTVIKNLAKPNKKETMTNLASLNRIWWTDDTPRSVRELSQALEFRLLPPILIAFFPQDLEERLSDMELEYAKKHGNKAEGDIAETVFQVKRRGGKYQPEVLEQRYK